MKENKNETFFSKIFRFIKKQCILALISAVILLIGSVLFLDSRISPIRIHLPDAAELLGQLSINNRLRLATVLHLRKIKGCESMALVNGYIYCGTHDSKLIKFNDTHIESSWRLGPANCKGVSECGRCLGVRHDGVRKVIVFVDAYHGVFEFDLATEKIKKIFPREGDSIKVTLFNDLDILSNGDIVVSESSTKYQLHNIMSALMEGRPNGRLIIISRDSGQYRIVSDSLFFPNGVQVHSRDPNVVLVVETLKLRILAVDIRLSSPSIMENPVKVFADSLPGFPDNIRPSYSKGGYWVNFANIRHSGNSFYIDTAMTYPFLRNCLKKFFSDPILHMMVSTNHGIVVRYDEIGNVAESLHDHLGVNVTTSSETLEVDNYLYLANYYLPFIVKIRLQ